MKFDSVLVINCWVYLTAVNKMTVSTLDLIIH
jgi:hypothetical protein